MDLLESVSISELKAMLGRAEVIESAKTEITRLKLDNAELLKALEQVIMVNPTISFTAPEAFKYIAAIENARKVYDKIKDKL